ncbi:FkbM family methyltransferase [Ferribacterium limneticum]|uniref:FkbM family methyltransferase n=1 Tax=Ferribacterium limneticum TaxID=76259 RepID=UPI001CF95C6B|nr:FkbM family methyltransferase [Ferribacterium limneticum]UCV19778.1 FkbM family methyltransferase [Ferribacterium limneticum]
MKLLFDLIKTTSLLDDTDLFKLSETIEKYKDDFKYISTALYERLTPADQECFVAWFLKRWAKVDIVSPTKRSKYDAIVKDAFASHGTKCIDGREYVIRKYLPSGYDFTLLGYDWFTGVHDITFDQYCTDKFAPHPGDIIIDGGAFIGDTAVLFNAKTKGNCEIHAFELLDENLALLHHNLNINGIKGNVFANRLALGDKSNVEVSIAQPKLQASTSLKWAGAIKVEMIKLDDYVTDQQLERVDLIKFDIEGAEIPALEGARKTILKFRPRLALCLYHSWDDVITIPKFLDSLGFEYEYEFKWVQLSLGTEGVLLATPRDYNSVAQPSPPVDLAALEAGYIRLFGAYNKKYQQADKLWKEKLAQI